MEADALFKRASCGLALHGTYVGGGSELIGSRRAPKQLLRPPEVCDLVKSDQPYKKESILFSSIQEGNKFCEHLKNSGWTVAAHFSASFWGVGVPVGVAVSGGGGRGQVNEMNSKSSQVTSEAYHMRYLYIPKASFRILRQQMRLTEEALDDIGRVHTPEDAVAFLSHYNSHLSTGIYHVGGVLLNGVTIKSQSETTMESLLEKISSNANGEAEASYMNVKGGVKAVYVNNKSSASTSSSSRQEAMVRCAHTAIGPQTDDEDEFRTGLQDMSTWHIIDTSLTAELTPVWEIALMETSNESLRQACDLLREAWQTSVESVAVESKTGRLYELWCHSLQQARTNKVTCLLQELQTSSSPQTLQIQLSNLWLEASRRVKSDDFVQTSDRLRLFQDADFQHLLSSIVESTDNDMDDAKNSVHRLIADMQQLLPDIDVSLSQSVKNFMRSYAQKQISTDRLPTLEELSSSSRPLELTTPKFKVDNVWTPQKEDVLLENIQVLPYKSFCTKNALYTYNGDFLVDRPIAKSSEDLCKTMMDRVRHRQEPLAAMCNPIHGTSNNDEDDDDDDFFGSNSRDGCSLSSSPFDHSRGIDSPLEILMQLLRSSDLVVQISVLQLLLEERCAVPLVIPRADDSEQFYQLVEALKFVQVKLDNQENLEIAENRSLLRVVYASNRGVVSQRETADMACEVMNCQFPSKYLKKESSGGSAVLELGVGFLENAKEQRLEYVPCLVFNVSGDHNKLGVILEKVADIVIIEMDLNEQPSKPSWTSSRNLPTRFWSISPSGRGGNRLYDHVWGNFKDITKAINQFLLKTIKAERLQRGNGGALTLVQCLSSLAPLNEEKPTSSCEYLDAIQFDQVKPSLSLQRLYTEEAGYYFESLRKRGQAAELGRQMERCKEERATQAGTIAKLPILQHFVHILGEPSYVKRTISILHLQLAIDQKLEGILHKASRKVNDAFEKTQKMPTDSVLKERYNAAKREHVDQMLGLEHLWRELSHIFVADSKRQAHLPKLAAYHLLDGHPLEILDGEATTFHNLWVNRVLVELNTQLQAILKREPKVFVLSVVGLQSSGKSTLLNVMFGTKLKASAGMCTRGVFLQLVKSEWPEFDYVLILDTMGLRSPEFFGLKDSVAQDNRLATFAVLPADACIVMVANEEDNGLKDVLPMVMLAFKGSALAEKYGRKIQSKLFFVYRSVDINDTKKLERNQRKLQVDLTEASLAIGNLNYCGTGDRVVPLESDGVSPLSDFQINTSDEKLSDVKYFGNVKKGTKPPGDTPDWEYGTKVEELREYIHKRVLDAGRWKENTHELVKWMDYLGMVWQSISEANFELSFLDHIEHASYQEMQTKLAMSRQKIGKKWQDEFEKLINDLQTIAEIGDQPLVTLWTILRSKVDGTVQEEEEKVLDVLDQKQCKKWKVAEIDRWNFDCSTNENHWKGQLRDCIDGVLNFDKVVKDYTNKIQQEISEAGVKHHDADVDSRDRERRMSEDFEGIFKRILGQAAIKHPPMAKKVAGRIHDLYVNDAVVGRKFSFEDNSMELASVGQRVFWDDSKNEPGNSSTIDIVWNAPNSIMQAFKNLLKPFRKGRDEVTSGFKFKNDDTEIQNLICKVQSYLEDAGSIPKNAVVEIQALISKVMSYLEDVKQYSDHLVEAMMKLTQRSEKQFSKHVQHFMHKVVKALLTARLTKVQEQWDSDHNVSKRLETQREYLWKQFRNQANKLAATNRLSMAFCDLLEEHHLVFAFEELITKSVSNKLHSEQWVCNWEVMRAYLDLYLIKLIHTNQIDRLLKCVSDGTLLYNTVVGNFITREIAEQLKDGHDSLAWTQLRDTICDSVRTAAFEAVHPSPKSSHKRPLIFQKSIIKSLGHVSTEIARLVSINVSEEVCSQYEEDIDFNQISSEVVEKVRGIHFNPTSSTSKVVDMVRTRMIKSKSDSIRPRCDTMCPRCRVTCLLSANHIGKHNALHQSEGLSGTREYYSNELLWLSCAKCVELGWMVRDKEVSVPYKDYWLEHHSEWALPSNIMGMTKVREYIFANFQKELLQKYPDLKACSDIPPHFKLLKLEELKVELDSVILSKA